MGFTVMSDFLQNPYTVGGMTATLSSVIVKLYLDSKAKDKIIQDISQARVDDLKEINSGKDESGKEIATMVRLIYNKLESEKRQ